MDVVSQQQFTGKWIRFCEEGVSETLTLYLGPIVAGVIAKAKSFSHHITFFPSTSSSSSSSSSSVVELSGGGVNLSIVEECNSLHKTIVSPLSVVPAYITINHLEYSIHSSFNADLGRLDTIKLSRDSSIEIIESRQIVQGFLQYIITVKVSGHPDHQCVSWFSLTPPEDDHRSQSSCSGSQLPFPFELKVPITPTSITSAATLLPILSNHIAACQYVCEYQIFNGSHWVDPFDSTLLVGTHLFQWNVSSHGSFTNPSYESVAHLKQAQLYNLLLPDLFVIFREFTFIATPSSTTLGWEYVTIQENNVPVLVDQVHASGPSPGQLRRRLWVRILVPIDEKQSAESDVFSRDTIGSKPVVCRGLLWKRGSFVKSWRKRMFVLRDSYLTYYDVSGTRPVLRGRFLLSGAVVSPVSPEDCFGQLFGIALTLSSGEIRYLSATDELQRELWTTTIAQVITVSSATGRPPTSFFPLCNADEILAGGLFIQNRERDEWVLHKCSLRARTLHYYSDISGVWQGSLDIPICTYTDNMDVECEFSLEVSIPAGELGVHDDTRHNVLRMLAKNVDEKNKWRLALHNLLKAYGEHFEWSTFNFLYGELDVDVAQKSETISMNSVIDSMNIEYSEILSAVDDNMSAYSGTTASSSAAKARPMYRKSLLSSISKSLKKKIIRPSSHLKDEKLTSSNLSMIREGPDETTDVQTKLPDEKGVFEQRGSISEIQEAKSDGSIVNIDSAVRGASFSQVVSSVPSDIQAVLREQNIDASAIFRGIWTLKKVPGELVYRKRFVWIDPAERSINWAKSEEDRNEMICKSIHLPLSALEIKPPLERTQCFGVSYGGTSIRIQLPLINEKGASKRRSSVAAGISNYDPATDATVWVRLIHILRTT